MARVTLWRRHVVKETLPAIVRPPSEPRPSVSGSGPRRRSLKLEAARQELQSRESLDPEKPDSARRNSTGFWGRKRPHAVQPLQLNAENLARFRRGSSCASGLGSSRPTSPHAEPVGQAAAGSRPENLPPTPLSPAGNRRRSSAELDDDFKDLITSLPKELLALKARSMDLAGEAAATGAVEASATSYADHLMRQLEARERPLTLVQNQARAQTYEEALEETISRVRQKVEGVKALPFLAAEQHGHDRSKLMH
mmetsp:Transcript_18123/g.52804  ORF Transcript_18123/g.52804 Transcript_18123/m.52804 type:complete len:253 (-) Transcript_18123:88-846(-)